MNQAPLELMSPPSADPVQHDRVEAADSVDATGFDVGWDHAHHGLVPPPELLLAGTPLGQGWRAGKAVFGRRTLASSRATRQWLALRVLAWRQGIAFDVQQVTAPYIAQLHTERCPVLRTPLGGATGQPDAAVIERLNPKAGFAAGNLVVMSQRAAQARAGVDVLEALRRARRAVNSGESVHGLDAAAWFRLATLRAYATPLPFHEAARLPLAALPPNGVRVLNAVQGLQALLTSLFNTPGWSARSRALAALLPRPVPKPSQTPPTAQAPEHPLRHDFNLLIGALAPRVLEAGSDPQTVRHALEDAWLHERVQRRWQHFALSLGEAATAVLLERAADAGLAGARTLHHAADQATEGRALAETGRALPAWQQPATAPWQRQRTSGPHAAC